MTTVRVSIVVCVLVASVGQASAQALLTAAPVPVPIVTTAPRPHPVGPPVLETGMAAWAFWVAVTGQAADLLTTEIALQRGLVEGNTLMTRRAVRVPLKLAIPLVQRWAWRRAPRAIANGQAILTGAWGFGPAAWNVYATVRWGQ